MTDHVLAPLAPLVRYLTGPRRGPAYRAALRQRNALVEQYQHIPGYVCRRLHTRRSVRRLGDLAISCQWPALIRAAEHWNPGRGTAFKTYAVWACFNALKTHADANQSVIRMAILNGQPRESTLPARKLAAAVVPNLAEMGRSLPAREESGLPEVWDELQSILGRLRQRDRDLLTWYYLDGLLHREVAARLGVSTERSRQLVRRALQNARVLAEEVAA